MRFADPRWLSVLVLLPLAVPLVAWLVRRRRRALARFAGGPAWVGRFSAEVSPHRRGIKLLLSAAGFAALGLALARPQAGAGLESVVRRGADVMLVVDTSLSMAAEDLPPSRLGHARHVAAELARRLAGDRIGLVSFAGHSVLNCPLTLDGSAVRLFLDALDVQAVAVPGTALADALRQAGEALASREERATERGRAIVLFTDGEDHEGGIDEALDELERAGIAVHTVGTGTVRGAPIPLRGPGGLLQEYKKDEEGKVVTTRLDEALLERIALETGGRYHRATANDLEVEEVERALAGLEQGETGARLRTRWAERFQIPLALALVALALEGWLGERRRPRPAASGRERRAA